MKKLIALLLILVILGLLGCSQTDQTTPTTTMTPDKTTASSADNKASTTDNNIPVSNIPTVPSSPAKSNDIITPNTVPTTPANVGNPTISSAAISNDIESLSKEIASIEINDSNAITPITDAELGIE